MSDNTPTQTGYAKALALIEQAAAEGWTELDLAGLGLEELPGEIGRLIQLETLNLSSNQIAVIPDAIAQLTNLTDLDLSDNRIVLIPEAIAQLTNLHSLYLSDNQIAVIPEAIAQLTNLTDLDLSDNKIVIIPDVIAQLANLTDLDFSNNQIAVIPEVIAQRSQLESLSFIGNQISIIPDAIAQLTNLDSLYLTDNQIVVIPDAIAQLTNLTCLYLSSNQIAVIPDSVAQLTNLNSLDIGGNQIVAIPEAITQLTNLTALDFWVNQIAVIPETIAQLSNLTKLNISSNQIAVIPEAIAELTNLTSLSLWSNQIAVIPDAIAQLANLTSLDLSRNQIAVIPDAIAQLTNLTSLNLWSNQIEVIPDFLSTLPNLKKLDLRRNPLPISPEILGPPELHKDPGSITDIFNYLNQLNSVEVRPLNEAKLLLVGQGSVGKTSLINRLLHDHYNPTEPQTDGLAVHSWPIHVNSKDIRLNVWDFGGQETYHATHQFFLTKRSLYLLVCNCRTSEDENRLEYWLKLIQSFGDASPVIIVGNKKDEQPLDLNRKALRDKYPNIKAILETSCQTGDGIPELRTAITQQIAQLREVYDLLPLKWFAVKEQLEAMDQDFISYNQYIGICHKNDIPEEHNQNQLITLLHNLGLVLNYRDHPILQSTNVLNPNWVTTGIYAILSDETLKTETQGILTPSDLCRILDPQRYPKDRHHYLIELMKEFQLGFPMPHCPQSRFLLPGLLPKEEPENTELKGDTLEFQYHYSILPASIMSRFIVLTHDRIHKQTFWRSGVMLAYREGDETYNIARIKADPEDRKIFISISGRDSTRRTFLSILRDTFSTIHRSFANPDDITEWVPVPGHPDADPLEYKELLGLEEMGDRTVTIGKLKLRLDLSQLLDGYESRESRENRRQRDRGHNLHDTAYEDMKEIAKLAVSRPITATAEATAMTDQSQKIQNFNGPMSGVIASDHATVENSTFTQTNNATTAELLNLIAQMRQTATQLPTDIQEDLTIDLDDLETEIQKPEDQRSLPKLKKRLGALIAAVGIAATPIAASTDFANTTLDLGSKLGIELKLP
jgi:internalin A